MREPGASCDCGRDAAYGEKSRRDAPKAAGRNGSPAAGVRPDAEGAHRSRDVLDAPFAHVLEAQGEPVTDVVADRPGDHDAAGLGQGFEAGRDIDAVAEDVAAFDDDVADVDADPKDDVPLGRQAGVARLGAALDLEPATHRLNDARELGEEAVAGLLNERAAARADRRRNDLALQRGKAPVGALLVAAHEAAVARDVGGEDGGQLALHVREIRNPRCDATPAGAGARPCAPAGRGVARDRGARATRRSPRPSRRTRTGNPSASATRRASAARSWRS